MGSVYSFGQVLEIVTTLTTAFDLNDVFYNEFFAALSGGRASVGGVVQYLDFGMVLRNPVCRRHHLLRRAWALSHGTPCL